MTYNKQLFADSDNVLNYDGLSTYDAKIKEYLKTYLGDLMAYPVGYIYETMDASFNPNGIFPGTWEEIKDRFLRSSSTEEVGATGGEESHRLTIDEMASHRHGISVPTTSTTTTGSGSNRVISNITWGSSTEDSYSSYAGGYISGETPENSNGGVPFSIVPNYIVVKMWRRTA